MFTNMLTRARNIARLLADPSHTELGTLQVLDVDELVANVLLTEKLRGAVVLFLLQDIAGFRRLKGVPKLMS